MELTPLPNESSALDATHYDAASRTLHVRFNSGQTYRYDGVPQTKYDGLIADASHGTYFAKQLRPHHKGVKV